MVRRAYVLCLVVVLGFGAGCTDERPASSPSPVASTSTTVPSSASPTRKALEPEEACGGAPFDVKKVRALDPGGPAYAGAGPHPAMLVTMHFAEDPYVTKLPRAWDANLRNLPAQLLVCASVDETFRQRVVDSCRYERSDGTATTVKVLSARYRYRVFEVKTGRPVVTFTVPGTRNSCPGIAPAGVSTSYDRIVADADLAAKLRPFVLGPAR